MLSFNVFKDASRIFSDRSHENRFVTNLEYSHLRVSSNKLLALYIFMLALPLLGGQLDARRWKEPKECASRGFGKPTETERCRKFFQLMPACLFSTNQVQAFCQASYRLNIFPRLALVKRSQQWNVFPRSTFPRLAPITLFCSEFLFLKSGNPSNPWIKIYRIMHVVVNEDFLRKLVENQTEKI